MSVRGRGRGRVTRKNPLAKWGEEQVEEKAIESGEAEDMEPGLAAGAQALEDRQQEQEPEIEYPAVKQKLSTPQPSHESIGVGQQFMNEIREFMYRQQRNEKLLFDGLEDLKDIVYRKPSQDRVTEDAASQQNPYALPTPAQRRPPPRPCTPPPDLHSS